MDSSVVVRSLEDSRKMALAEGKARSLDTVGSDQTLDLDDHSHDSEGTVVFFGPIPPAVVGRGAIIIQQGYYRHHAK